MFKNYLKIAFRNLLRQKVFSLINIIGLAIGLAACMLILLFIQYELSFESFHSHKSEIYRVLTIDKAMGTHSQRVGITMPAFSPAAKEAFPEVISQLRLTYGQRELLRSSDRVGCYGDYVRAADTNFFSFFDFSLKFGDESTALHAPYTIILTEEFAGKIFGSADCVGKTLHTGGGLTFTVTGVLNTLPSNTHIEIDALMSMSTLEAEARRVEMERFGNNDRPIWLERWNLVTIPAYLRIRSGTDINDLTIRMNQLCRDNEVAENFEISLQHLNRIHLHSRDVIYDTAYRKSDISNIYLFSAIALLILIIATVNYMNLATARSTRRAREVGLRKVVGSNRKKLIGQFLTESVLISFLALIVSIPLAELALPLLKQATGISLQIALFENPLLFLFFCSMLMITGILSGLYPAFVLTGFSPVSVLKGDLREGIRGSALRKGLVVFQFALSISMIGLTGIIKQQMNYMQSTDLGYNREDIVFFEMNDRFQRNNCNLLENELENCPSILSVSRSNNIPGRSFGRMGIIPEGSTEDEIWIWSGLYINPDFIETMGMEIVEGRNIDYSRASDSSEAALINQTAANQLGWEKPLGKRLFANEEDSTGREVIGVVKDFHFAGLQQEIEPVAIYPLAQFNGSFVIMRIARNQQEEALHYAEEVWTSIFPDHPFAYFFLNKEYENLHQADINTGKVVNIFSALAVLIACLGLFGLASHSAMSRGKEISVRKVLGASTFGVVKLLITDFTRWVMLANVIAFPLIYLISEKWLENFAYRIGTDWRIFAAAGFSALILAIVTVSFQAIKSALANPVNMLKSE